MFCVVVLDHCFWIECSCTFLFTQGDFEILVGASPLQFEPKAGLYKAGLELASLFFLQFHLPPLQVHSFFLLLMCSGFQDRFLNDRVGCCLCRLAHCGTTRLNSAQDLPPHSVYFLFRIARMGFQSGRSGFWSSYCLGCSVSLFHGRYALVNDNNQFIAQFHNSIH